MSIERQLSDAFTCNESSLACPPSLDARILADYRQQVMEKRGTSLMSNRKGMTRAVMIALVLVVLCGFAYAGTRLLYSDAQGHYSIRMQSNKALALDQDTLEYARASLKTVQAQLAPGQKAVVYLPDVLPGNPPFSTIKLDYISDAEQWRAALLERDVTEPLPNSLLEGKYAFAGGAVNSPFHYVLGLDSKDMVVEMQSQQQSEGDGPLWRVMNPSVDAVVSYYTSVYRDADHEPIYYTWGVVEESSIKVDGFTAPSTEYEELELNGRKAHYTKNLQSLVGESSVYQDVMWIEEGQDQTIVYHVESDSASMTKERLIEVAASLLEP